MATKYEGLTTAQWANRIVDYNPGKFDKSALIKHYTAQQLGKFQEGGNIQLAKGIKCKPKIDAKTPAKAQKAPKPRTVICLLGYCWPACSLAVGRAPPGRAARAPAGRADRG